ncbi:MAG: alpha/beta hydrolase fold domain-containing protein [Burkholderiaceae bacterium]|nr:alpha/beta hydrolase fold domain-containing protein [Burkholderiaceae bacterium]
MMARDRWLSAGLAWAVLSMAAAQSAAQTPAPAAPPSVPMFRAQPATPMALPVPIELGQGSGPAFQWTSLIRERVLRNSTRAQLYALRPTAGQADGPGKGRAVLVLPGGGYKFLAIENEGLPVAQRLAAAGYTAYVLVYRVMPTPVDDTAFAELVNAEIAQRFAPGAAKAPIDLAAHGPAVDDALQAMAWLRAHAAEQGFSAARIALIGFSAGARTGRALVERAEPAQMPDSLALIYGGFASTRPRAPVPPLFLAQAADDALFPPDHFDIVQDWRRAGQRVELHLYERGNHGFGLMAPRGNTSDGWFDSYLAWLARQ